MTDGDIVLQDVRGPSALGGGWRRSLGLSSIRTRLRHRFFNFVMHASIGQD